MAGAWVVQLGAVGRCFQYSGSLPFWISPRSCGVVGPCIPARVRPGRQNGQDQVASRGVGNPCPDIQHSNTAFQRRKAAMSGGKKRVRFAETHEVREFELPEAIRKRPRLADPMAELERALDPMAQLESEWGTCLFQLGRQGRRYVARGAALQAHSTARSCNSFLSSAGSPPACPATHRRRRTRPPPARRPLHRMHLRGGRLAGPRRGPQQPRGQPAGGAAGAV